MPNLIEELRKMPIRVNPNFDYHDYRDEKRKEYYHREVIPKIPVDYEHEKHLETMKTCFEFGIFQLNYYFDGPGRNILRANGQDDNPYVTKNIYLRESILVSLQKVDCFLQKFGLRLVVLSGYRHPELQKDCSNGVEAQNRPKNARPASKLFTDPDLYSPHCTGAAVDVEIWDMAGHCMLNTKLPNRETTMGLFYLEQLSILNQGEEEARSNRRLLHNVLATPAILGDDALVPHPSEHWHLSRGDRLAAFFAANGHHVYYEMIYSVAP